MTLPTQTIGLAFMIAAAIAGGAAAFAGEGDAKPATRNEAAAAFMKGCRERVDAIPELTNEQRTIACVESRDCIIDALFEGGGQRKRPVREVTDIFARCIARAQRKAFRTGGPPGSRKRPGPRARAADATSTLHSGWVEIVQCVRELKPAALKTLIAECHKVALDQDACDPKYPCFHIENAIRDGCATLQKKGAAPAFCGRDTE